nr:reverse transcriptase domain-containing protein [Tanacetum cinerariifolium]
MRVLQVKQQVKAVTPNCETSGGPHSFNDCPATVGQTQNVYAAGAYQGNSYQPQGNRNLLSYHLDNYLGPPGFNQNQNQKIRIRTSITKTRIKETFILRGTTKEEANSSRELAMVKTRLQPIKLRPVVAPIIEPVVAPVSALKPRQKPSISVEQALTFHFPTEFVIVDFDADPRVPLILGRSFLKTERALIDVLEGEPTLRVGKEDITFNLDQTSRYSANYNDMTMNRIDVIDMACEEYSKEVLGFSDVITSSNTTPYYDSIVSTSSPTLTPFDESDFLLEEVDAFLALEDDPTSPEVDQSYELKICEAKTDKSSIDEPPKVELKDLPPHLEYAFREDDDKLPVIFAKDLSVEVKTALITVLKSHKQAIAWKLSDINEPLPPLPNHEQYLPSYKKELKVCEAKTIKSSVDEPPEVELKDLPHHLEYAFLKGDKKLLVIIAKELGRWRVCIDYQKLNEATHKDHFPLPFMDQMLERLTGNEYYYFLDGNSFQTCLSYLEKMLKRCKDTNLSLNCEKSHFMVKKGIVLGHKISKNEIKVDKAKVKVIAKLPHPTTVKGIRSFLGHVGFYRRFIQDFSKIAWPMTRLLEKDTPFFLSKEYVKAFNSIILPN